MNAAALTLAGALLALLVGCGRKPGPVPERAAAPPAPKTEAEALARGRAIAAEAFAVLSGNLMRALVEQGPARALHFCSVHAAPLSGGVAATNNVRLQRIALRARNPQNRAAAAEEEILQTFQGQLTAATTPAPVVTRNAAGHFVFYAPIVLNNPLCLQCHGDPEKEIAAETREMLRKLYPEDRATGFRPGDLRGAWRIEFLPDAP